MKKKAIEIREGDEITGPMFAEAGVVRSVVVIDRAVQVNYKVRGLDRVRNRVFYVVGILLYHGCLKFLFAVNECKDRIDLFILQISK